MKRKVPFSPSNRLFYEKLPQVAIIFKGDALLVRHIDGTYFLPCTQEKEFADLTVNAGDALCIGSFCELDCGVWELAADDKWQPPDGTEFVEIRFALHTLDVMSVNAVSRAKELISWRRKREFCGVCGCLLADNENDISRICPDCGNVFYPVLAPAVIVAVCRGDELLLAHNARFKNGLYGLVAGFVEAGENLESAVAREVREEVGIEVENITYFASQVWPFPNSLMTGFFADYLSGELNADGVEITDAQWFKADSLPEIPRPGSIARNIIDEFVRRHTD